MYGSECVLSPEKHDHAYIVMQNHDVRFGYRFHTYHLKLAYILRDTLERANLDASSLLSMTSARKYDHGDRSEISAAGAVLLV